MGALHPDFEAALSGGDTSAGALDMDRFASALERGPDSAFPRERKQEAPGDRAARQFREREDSGGQVAGHLLTGIGSTIIGGWRGLATLASGGTWDDAANAVREETERRTYQPTAEGAVKTAEVLGSKYNPLNWPGSAAKAAGEQAQDTTAQTRPFLSARGSLPTPGAPSPGPASPGVATAIETGVNAVPYALGLRGGGQAVRPALRAVDRAAIPADAGAQAAPSMSIPKAGEPAQPGAAAQPTKPRMVGPAATLEDVKAPEFSESAPSVKEGKLPAAEQSRRAQVLQRVGLEDARESAVTGNAKAAATDYQTSRLDNSSGNYMKARLDQERQALHAHAEGIVADTGGTLGNSGEVLYSRGNSIIAPLDSLREWFDGKISGLYKTADERAGGVPVEMPKTHELLGGDQAEFLGTTEGEALLRGVRARMKSLGMVDAEGKAQPVTVAQAERLKQYLGNQWQPRTGKLIRTLKDAIDDDVTMAAGDDVYREARAMRAVRAATLDNPKGISRIMDSSGPEGINRSVPVEKIPDAVAGMPYDQLHHVVRTLENAPAEIRPQAQAALAEIRAHFANKVLDSGAGRVGQWGARDVSKFLNANRQKMALVFTPEQLAKFSDLNDAGHILARDQSYPGAAVQAHNLARRGVMAGLEAGGATVGGAMGAAVGMPGVGAAAGGLAGSALGRKFNEAAALKGTQKRFVKLSDFPGAKD